MSHVVFGKEAMMLMDVHQAVTGKQQGRNLITSWMRRRVPWTSEGMGWKPPLIPLPPPWGSTLSHRSWAQHILHLLYHKPILNTLRTWLNFLKLLDYGCIHNGGTGNTSVDQADRYARGVAGGIAQEKKMPARKVVTGGLMVQSWCSQH